jgi:GNAT superfamily N-acetyltransferase
MSEEDLDAVADLAQSARLLEASWQPQLWSPSSGARGVHPLVLRRQLDGGLPALVAEERSGALVGAILPTEPPGCDRPGAGSAWAVDDFFVASPTRWRTTGRALLVALAGRAAAAGVDRIVVSCGGSDDELRHVLDRAGLTPSGWVRVRDLVAPRGAAPVGVRRATPGDAAAVTALLARAASHDHTLRPPPPGAAGREWADVLVLDDHGVVGVAVVGPSLPPPPGHEPRRGTTLAEPVVLDDRADWTNDGARLVRGVEWVATGRDDAQVVIPCGPEESRMDEELGSAGYAIRLEWWTLDVEGRGGRGATAVRRA